MFLRLHDDVFGEILVNVDQIVSINAHSHKALCEVSLTLGHCDVTESLEEIRALLNGHIRELPIPPSGPRP